MGQGWLTGTRAPRSRALRPVRERGDGRHGDGRPGRRPFPPVGACCHPGPLRLPQYSGGRLKMTTRLTILPSRTLK